MITSARSLLAAAGLFAFALTGLSQTPPVSETIEVRLIEVDVVVTDRAGNRVHGLTANDFDIFEGRSPRTITNFTEFRSDPATAADASQPAPAGGGAVASIGQSEAARRPQSFLILIDSLPRGEFVRARVFENLEDFTMKLMHEGDHISVVFWDPAFQRASTILEPSSDPREAIRRLRAMSGTTETRGFSAAADAANVNKFLEQGANAAAAGGRTPATDLAEQQSFTGHVTGEIELMFFRRKVRGIRRLVSSLSATPGKKTLLYVSKDFRMPSERSSRLAAIRELDELVKSANAAGVTFYGVGPVPPGDDDLITRTAPRQDDSVLVRQAEIDALQKLTVPTGGTYEFGPVSVASLGKTILEDLGSYYSLAYHSSTDGRDREHHIVVRTKNRDYRVRTRQSVVEKSKETVARETLMAGIFSDSGSDDLRFEVSQGPPRRTGPNRWLLPLVVKIPSDHLQYAQEGKDRVALVKVLIAAANGVAEVTPVAENNLRVASGRNDRGGFVTYSVQIMFDNRGSKLSIGVMDQRSGLTGVKTIDNRGRKPE